MNFLCRRLSLISKVKLLLFSVQSAASSWQSNRNMSSTESLNYIIYVGLNCLREMERHRCDGQWKTIIHVTSDFLSSCGCHHYGNWLQSHPGPKSGLFIKDHRSWRIWSHLRHTSHCSGTEPWPYTTVPLHSGKLGWTLTLWQTRLLRWHATIWNKITAMFHIRGEEHQLNRQKEEELRHEWMKCIKHGALDYI